ncbi:hypothetical protein Q8A73_016332 [Channa argus]|nr:hypothetical protein Q8A73_016332 [Channa argus]
MDDFVRKKLTEWDLSDWIQRFKDGCIDEKRFYYLNNSDIKELIPTVGPRAQFREHHRQLKHFHQKPKEPAASVQHFHLKPKEPAASVQIPQHFHLKPKEPPASVQVQPSTSYTGKRKLNPEGESSYSKPPTCKRQCNTSSQTNSDIMFEVKKIMKEIDERLGKQGDTPFNAFLRAKINDLETDKRELVGVFGKTGAGKSSLINAIIREENLLPSGTGSACTSVMIKVEASNQYEAHVEFITEEEWKEELWTFDNFLKDSSSQRIYDDDDDDDNDDREEYREKLSAVYGEEWKQKSPEELMDKKYFKEIPEFFIRKKKIVPCESAADLSKKIIKYTRSESEEGSGKILKRCYWPLVKCVTVRVPCSDLLQHVTLVDLPGNGDCNKSRDTMWKELVTCCSTVWIVTDMNRAVSEKEPWEILKTACSLMGNGGECQKIHFICTKSDLTEVSTASRSAKEVRELRIKKNKETKDKVWKRFKQLHKIKEHFSDSCLKVFTVSAKEFVEDKCAKPENEAAQCQGKDMLKKMRETIENHVNNSKNVMFEEAKKVMLDNLGKLMEEIVKTLESTLKEAITLSLRTDGYSVPDEDIDKETFLRLEESGSINILIPTIGPRVKFRKRLREYLQWNSMKTCDFVRGKLTEWDLCEVIQKFEDEDIDKETFLHLEESGSINILIPKIGPRVKFKKRLREYLQAQRIRQADIAEMDIDTNPVQEDSPEAEPTLFPWPPFSWECTPTSDIDSGSEMTEELIYPGATVTRGQGMLGVILFILRHCLTAAGTSDLMALLNYLIPNLAPALKYLSDKDLLKDTLKNPSTKLLSKTVNYGPDIKDVMDGRMYQNLLRQAEATIRNNQTSTVIKVLGAVEGMGVASIPFIVCY